MFEELYFNPAKIFMVRDFFNIKTAVHGAIQIGIDGGSGWYARKTGSFESLVIGLDVWQMCRWLNDNRAQVEKR